MKIGLYTDSLQDLSFTAALDWIAAQGIEAVKIGTGNFSQAAHCNLTRLVSDADARAEFIGAIESRGLSLSALNCNGNLLDPHPERGERSRATFYKTVQAANLLGLDTVVTMSGCPGDPSGTPYPNWVTHPHQPEFGELHRWQWNEVARPFWEKAGRYAADQGVKIAIEMHPGQMVYNTDGLLRLREIAGPSLGANFDPSHLFHQGMDPMRVVRTFGADCVFHVHAKDTRIDPYEAARTGVMDMRDMQRVGERAGAYRTLGFGHGELWWREFISALRTVGYDGTLSIEHEDPLMSAREGIVKSVQFLKSIVPRTMPKEQPL